MAIITGLWIGIGLLLTGALGHGAVARADLFAERWLSTHRDPPLNVVTSVLSSLASTTEVIGIGLFLAAVAALTWRRWREPAMLVIALAGQLVVFLSVTAAVHRPRPPVPRLDVAPPTSSYPSGHTAAAVVLYGALAVVTAERFHGHAVHAIMRVVAVLVPSLVAASRLYRGMHYPTDVRGGAALGVVWLLISLRSVRLGVFDRAGR
jgi:undecaprenyl-diphosphatase